jgi:16S rRNA (adenine1518-N6/adenine1519-N6)-dimethyltransferase
VVLRGELGGRANVEIAEENALTFDYAAAAARAGRPVVVVGNLPYHLASQLLFRILDARRQVARAVVMLQKEMADRIVARPGTKAYGALGVMITTFADVRLVVRARPGAFFPAPKVDSAVVELVPLPDGRPRQPLLDAGRHSAVVHAAFGQRRKTLRNALRARFAAPDLDAALARAGIDGARRGETLSIDEFIRLANELPDARAA